jgi:hypothetical protein
VWLRRLIGQVTENSPIDLKGCYPSSARFMRVGGNPKGGDMDHRYAGVLGRALSRSNDETLPNDVGVFEFYYEEYLSRGYTEEEATAWAMWYCEEEGSGDANID